MKSELTQEIESLLSWDGKIDIYIARKTISKLGGNEELMSYNQDIDSFLLYAISLIIDKYEN